MKIKQLLYVVLLTSQNVTVQTDYDDLMPAISPDGTEIIFCSTRNTNITSTKKISQFLYIAKLDGTSVKKVSPPNDSTWYYNNGTFLNKKQKIVYTITIEKYTQVAISNYDGTEFELVTNSTADNFRVSPSPDGLYFVYSSAREKRRDIYLYDFKLKKETRLTADTLTDDGTSFSPDGKTILFYSNREGNFNIYTMNTDGSNVKRITPNDAHYEFPRWSPDGSKIAYTKRIGEKGSVCIMNANGTGEVILSTHIAKFAGPANGCPVWFPDGKWVCFHRLEDNKHFRLYKASADGRVKELLFK
jgi:TolB protein